jgi:IrrE N-terminal-like domain
VVSSRREGVTVADFQDPGHNGGVPGPVTDVRAGVIRRRYQQRFGGVELPVPVGAIAEDLCGLTVEERDLDVSGMLVPADRRIYTNAAEPLARRRFTLAHELGHWVCQCLEGRTAPIYCRAEVVGLDPTARAVEREANVFAAELLMPEERVRDEWRRAASAEELAGWFGVSPEAMTWRLFSFGLVEEPPR